MSHTRITYRGSTLFVLGNIGTLILNIFILIWCLVWLGFAIITVCDSYEVDDFFDALPIIIGFAVGIGGSMATIWKMTSEIRDVKIERLEKKITKLESGKPNKMVTAEMEGDKEAAKDYLTMKKKAAESALKCLKHKDDEDSATFLATRKKEQALQNEVNRWNTAITVLNTI